MLTAFGEKDKPAPAAKMEIKISPSVTSRATDTNFETNDQIGLYVVNHDNLGASFNSIGNYVDNLKFTYNGTWTPANTIYWKDDKTTADFYLYYPYDANLSNPFQYNFTVKADQSTETAYKSSDFMAGNTKNVSPTTNSVTITAQHLMSQIVVTLAPGNGFTAESLSKAQISVKVNGIKCGATINIASGAVTASGNPESIRPLLSDKNYRAIIVPQSVAEGNLITVTVDGREYQLKKGFTFESGKRHNFTVTLSKTSNGVNVNISPWGDDGVNNGGTAE